MIISRYIFRLRHLTIFLVPYTILSSFHMTVHPLVRDLYKRAIIVGKDYPHPEGLDYVRRKWKEALRNPENCKLMGDPSEDEKIIRKAVGKGRYVIREMEGTIQLKKYRTMRRRYGDGIDVAGEASRIGRSLGAMLEK